MILYPANETERIFALDACKGYTVTATFDSGREIRGRLRGYSPQGGHRRWLLAGLTIGHRTLKKIEISL